MILFGYLNDHAIMIDRRRKDSRPLLLSLKDVTVHVQGLGSVLHHQGTSYVFAQRIPLPYRPHCRMPPAPPEVRALCVLYSFSADRR